MLNETRLVVAKFVEGEKYIDATTREVLLSEENETEVYTLIEVDSAGNATSGYDTYDSIAEAEEARKQILKEREK